MYSNNLDELISIWQSQRDLDEKIQETGFILDELMLLSREFQTVCFSNWLVVLRFLVNSIRQGEVDQHLLAEIHNIVKHNPHPHCVQVFTSTSTRVEEVYIEETLGNYLLSLEAFIIELLPKMKETLEQQDYRGRNMDFIHHLSGNLGYIMVVVKQVTAYVKEFNPRNDVSPKLIGNMAIALNDFSKELFDDFFGVQTIEQQNGTILTHRADADIYYVALAYEDSKFYEIWLQEFAKKTLPMFQKKLDYISFDEDEIQYLDQTLEAVINEKY